MPALAQPAALKFDETPLWEALAAIAKKYELPLHLDRVALTDIGVSPRAPVTADYPEATLDTALRDLLASVDLSFHIDHEMIVVTTPEVIEENLHIVVYPVADLTQDGKDFDTLIDNITASVRPTTWEEVGGVGGVEPWPNEPALVIAQTDEVHREIADLLAQLREVNAQIQKEQPAEVVPKDEKGEYSTVVFRLWQPWDEKAQVPEEAVVKLLQEMIEPESWKDDEVFVRTLPSRLIIRQKKSVQRQIYQSLIDLAILKPEPAFGGPFGLGGGLGGGDQGGGGGLFGGAQGSGFGGGFGGGGLGGGLGGGGVGGLPPAK